MAESMKDYETELEASFKKIEEGDILTGTVISVDEKEVVIDLKYYAEGIIPAEDYSREPGFSLKEEVKVGDEVSATVVRNNFKTPVYMTQNRKNIKGEGFVFEADLRTLVHPNLWVLQGVALLLNTMYG